MQSLRARLFGTRETQDLSLVDHARRWVSDTGMQVYQCIGANSPWAQRRIDDIAVQAGELERRGYLNHFRDFNETLVKPLKSGTRALVALVKATVQCAPDQNAVYAFSLWNALCFWFSVILLIVSLLLPGGSGIVEIVSVFYSYIAAYTYDFVFVRAPRTQWMLPGVVIMVLWVALQVITGIGGLVYIVPAVMAFIRAASASVLLLYAVRLYRAAQSAEESGQQESGWLGSGWSGSARREVMIEML
uniref:Uncharacterized protein n=1 Tax=Haptolina brevifila TaxID=156173 RepID=A0A6U7GFF4_9EUKA|mmetsp:Transcript_47386/g.94543  ORF Transcript_47386/g.94543 Transcript_47386/m.94543 type:complete len:246 (+) Transcript_47386:159-896(+)|eukprot:CAMPEP_0174726448 /NCGR_PEP_ID=MMETSP1094-20130205/47864_1 /TAXON_ID=156173 /ORGANISM="Chrysochromulina brevifilum, Strain UTEX LB 985" /LENGTH=245 /DNA_ID=CAMNT_0015928035 /DNA_START=295 /DNA_END=1032 /DNA_ORIENTATION=+